MCHAEFKRIKPMKIIITFPPAEGTSAQQATAAERPTVANRSITFPFFYDVFNYNVNEDLIDMSRFVMKHLVKHLWNYTCDSFTVDISTSRVSKFTSSIEVHGEVLELLADEKHKSKPDIDFNEVLTDYACCVLKTLNMIKKLYQ
jgi:hypothetical protein